MLLAKPLFGGVLDSNKIRKQVSARRSSLSKQNHQKASYAIADGLQKLPQVMQAQTIAAYIAIASEVSLTKAIDSFRQQNKLVVLPCIDIPKAGDMVFAPYAHGSSLETAGFGLSQPKISQCVPLENIDVVIVPLLAFNSSCYRIGWGKGYYDKFFAARQQRPAPPWLVGVGFACQQEEQIIPQPWDVRLDMVVTEDNVFAYRK